MMKRIRTCFTEGQNKEILIASQQEKQKKYMFGSGRQMPGMPCLTQTGSKRFFSVAIRFIIQKRFNDRSKIFGQQPVKI